MQKDINRTLKQIDSDIGEFTKCLERATSIKSVDEQRQYEDKLNGCKISLTADLEKVHSLVGKGVKLASKEKLEAARTRIEQELRRCSDFEKRSKLVAPAENIGKGDRVVGEKATSSENSETSEVQSVEEIVVAEVKVASDQLYADDAEQMEMAQEFVCKICYNVVGHTPQLSTCSHLYCGDCISKWFEVQPGNLTWARRAQNGGSVPCPICKEPLQKDTDLYAVCPEGEGNSAVLWEMLCGLKVMCANHAKCSSEGRCTWIGDYGSYQEHIHSCKNIPLAHSDNTPLDDIVTSITTPEVEDARGEVKVDKDSHLDVETTASETSANADSEKSYRPENESLPDPSEEFFSDEEESLQEGDAEEQVVEGGDAVAEKSLSSLIAELIDLRAKQGDADQAHAVNASPIELAMNTDDAGAQDVVDTVMNAGADPFQPATQKKAVPKKKSKKKADRVEESPEVPFPPNQAALQQYQAAAAAQMQYQAAARAQMTQMTQMAYLQRLRSAQMAQYQAATQAQYQAACWQAHMNQMRMGQHAAR